MTHTVTVAASSLYEAAVLGIAEFRRGGFAFAGMGAGTKLKVAVQPPAETHEIGVAKVQAWLDAAGRTPREQAKKVQLRQLLSHG